MRITDSRYDRDRVRFTLALRMIRLGARTQTIRQATGLSKERIRRLSREYVDRHADGPVHRLRGKSPRRMAFFRQTPDHELQAATLGSMLHACDLLAPAVPAYQLTPEEAARFCDIFDLFRDLCAACLISFEHAWYLRQALSSREEHTLAACQGCQSQWIRDTLDLLPDRCPACRMGLYRR